MKIDDWVGKWASIRPHKRAIISEESFLSYDDLNSRAYQLANLLHEKGTQKGDRVAVLLYNSKEYIEIVLASSIIGAILVPLNLRLSGPELEFILRDSRSDILFFGEEFMDAVKTIKPNLPIREGGYICVGRANGSWAVHYERAVREQPAEEPKVERAIGLKDPQMIMYTSGTTGLPKGAILSHRKTFYNVLNANIYYELTPNDIFLLSRALFHSGGLLVGVAPILYKGGTIILRKRLKPEVILQIIEKYRVTVIEAAATIFRFILEECDLEKYDLSSLRCCFTGGERVPVPLLEEYRRRGIVVSQIYGQTETSTITWLPIAEASKRLGSVGVPVFHGDLKIVNKKGEDVKPGAVGEILVSGPILMDGYWRRPQQTRETVRNGWLHTGDLARMDKDGFIYIVDREKDMYISGGENVYPAEVEKIYLENPKVLNVAVVGVPDAKWGEVGAVFIVLKNGEKMTEEEVLGFCEGKIAKYKIPKAVAFVRELPTTAAQKIQRYKLREDFLRDHSLGAHQGYEPVPQSPE